MKYILLICIFLWNIVGVSAQEVYLNKLSNAEVVSLGSFDNEGKLKVHEKGAINYVDVLNLEQTNQLLFKDFFEYINKNNLELLCSGSEPFWQVSLSKNKLTGVFVNEEVDKHLTLSYANTLGWGWYIMFNTPDAQLYGIIKRSDLSSSECKCGSDSEYNTLFECFISFNGMAYQGCVVIDKRGK